MDQYQNHQHFPDDDSMDPDKFIESFNLASCAEEKRHEFDLQYSVSYTQRLIQEHLGISVVQDLAFSSSAASSSFQMFQQTIDQLAPHHAGSEQNMPQFWKDLIKMSDPQVRQKPAAETSLGSNKLKQLEIVGVQGERAQDLNPAIINSNPSHNLSTTRSLTDSSSNVIVTSPHHSVNNSTRPNVSSMASDSHVIDVPMTPPTLPPHEDNSRLGFIVFIVECVGALTNLNVSSKPKSDQVLDYVVVACFALAFLISSTALLLHKRKPAIAEWMQKAAFVIGTFGFMGIMGMLLPSTITWCFTIFAFLLCMLMFAVANWIE